MSSGHARETSVCRYFAASGNCFFGDQCNFSHVTTRPSTSTPTNLTNSSIISISSQFPNTNQIDSGIQSYTSGIIPKSQRPCRNLALHGYCKYEGKGCEYNHDRKDDLETINSQQQQLNAFSSYENYPTVYKSSEVEKLTHESTHFPMISSYDNYSNPILHDYYINYPHLKSSLTKSKTSPNISEEVNSQTLREFDRTPQINRPFDGGSSTLFIPPSNSASSTTPTQAFVPGYPTSGPSPSQQQRALPSRWTSNTYNIANPTPASTSSSVSSISSGSQSPFPSSNSGFTGNHPYSSYSNPSLLYSSEFSNGVRNPSAIRYTNNANNPSNPTTTSAYPSANNVNYPNNFANRFEKETVGTEVGVKAISTNVSSNSLIVNGNSSNSGALLNSTVSGNSPTNKELEKAVSYDLSRRVETANVVSQNRFRTDLIPQTPNIAHFHHPTTNFSDVHINSSPSVISQEFSSRIHATDSKNPETTRIQHSDKLARESMPYREGLKHDKGIVPTTIRREREKDKVVGDRKKINSLFMSETLRQDLIQRSYFQHHPNITGSFHFQTSKDVEQNRGEVKVGQKILTRVNKYHSLIFLSPPKCTEDNSDIKTSLYKAVSGTDGLSYVLLRIEIQSHGSSFSSGESLESIGMATFERWKQVHSSSIISVRDYFISLGTEFGSENGSSSLWFVSDYFPGAISLKSKYFSPPSTSIPSTVSGITPSLPSLPWWSSMSLFIRVEEEVIWSYLFQLLCALKEIHNKQLNLSKLKLDNILVTSKNRLRLNTVCFLEFFNSITSPKTWTMSQREDLSSIGKLILIISCKVLINQNLKKTPCSVNLHITSLKDIDQFFLSKTVYTPTVNSSEYQNDYERIQDQNQDLFYKNNQTLTDKLGNVELNEEEVGDDEKRPFNPQQFCNHLVEYFCQHYSSELQEVVFHLLGLDSQIDPQNNRITNKLEIETILAMVAVRMTSEIESLHSYTDMLESELSLEVENGRLFRLISKLGFINERPEFDMDPNWSETGDRYLLKLFRDYVFHQVNEDGSPCVDLGHVVESLNKLDIGSPEKIALMSRDEQSVLVVSYKDLKRCVENSFNELLQKLSKFNSTSSINFPYNYQSYPPPYNPYTPFNSFK